MGCLSFRLPQWRALNVYTLSAAGRKGFEPPMMLTAEYFQFSAKVQQQRPSAAEPQPKEKMDITTKDPAQRSRNQSSKPHFTTEAQSSQSSEYLLIKNSLLCALRGREKKSPSALRPGSGRTANYLNYRLWHPFVLRFSKHERIFSHIPRLRGEFPFGSIQSEKPLENLRRRDNFWIALHRKRREFSELR